MEFIQRKAAVSAEMNETFPLGWTKSIQAQGIREKAGFDWIKSTVALPRHAHRCLLSLRSGRESSAQSPDRAILKAELDGPGQQSALPQRTAKPFFQNIYIVILTI
ncbi:hypothetical protein [Cohnella algarum]|uniref:hypothetical protein n=1 Tax=Cohnella algarum TaxID=2044859 RepID=UPI001967BF36|nr:hypothetical protein [Cohnella algarum]MBN2981877.1 hypothetical protein [Cohnella algarum]